MSTRKLVYAVAALALLVFALLGVSASGALQPAALAEEIHTSPDGKGYRFDRDGWIYVHIEGGAYERGYQHGYLVAPELAEILKNTKDLTYQDTGMEWQFFVEQAQTQFLPHLDDELLAGDQGHRCWRPEGRDRHHLARRPDLERLRGADRVLVAQRNGQVV